MQVRPWYAVATMTRFFLFYNTLRTTSLLEWFTLLRMLDISYAWPHPLPQRREGIWGLALQPAVAQELISYVTRTWHSASMGHDPDTIMCESSHVRSNSALDFSCAPTHDSARGFNSSLFTRTLHLAIYQLTGAMSCHVTECCSVIGPHSTVQPNSWL